MDRTIQVTERHRGPIDSAWLDGGGPKDPWHRTTQGTERLRVPNDSGDRTTLGTERLSQKRLRARNDQARQAEGAQRLRGPDDSGDRTT